MSVKDKTGRGVTVNSISSDFNDGTLTISIDTQDLFPDADVKMIPTDPEVVKIKNRGKWFNPPWSHLKQRITDLNPVSIAELGYCFYCAYIFEAEIWLEGK